MKNDFIKLIIKSLVFFAILSVVVILINRFYIDTVLSKTKIQRRENEYQNFIKDNGSRIKYLILGSSHSAHGINPAVISGAINFAEDAQNYIIAYYKLRKILEIDKVKVDNIILEVDLHSFSSLYSENAAVLENYYYYSKFISENEIEEMTNEPIWGIWLKSRFPSLGGGRNFFVSDLSEMTLGWSRNCTSFSDVKDKEVYAETRGREHFENKKIIDDFSLKYYRKVLEMAKRHGINLYLINIPVSEHYYNATLKHIDRDNFYELVYKKTDSIIDDYIVLDYFDYFFNQDNYFKDSDHLNCYGAEKLSVKILQDLAKNINL